VLNNHALNTCPRNTTLTLWSTSKTRILKLSIENIEPMRRSASRLRRSPKPPEPLAAVNHGRPTKKTCISSLKRDLYDGSDGRVLGQIHEPPTQPVRSKVPELQSESADEDEDMLPAIFIPTAPRLLQKKLPPKQVYKGLTTKGQSNVTDIRTRLSTPIVPMDLQVDSQQSSINHDSAQASTSKLNPDPLKGVSKLGEHIPKRLAKEGATGAQFPTGVCTRSSTPIIPGDLPTNPRQSTIYHASVQDSAPGPHQKPPRSGSIKTLPASQSSMPSTSGPHLSTQLSKDFHLSQSSIAQLPTGDTDVLTTKLGGLTIHESDLAQSPPPESAVTPVAFPALGLKRTFDGGPGEFGSESWDGGDGKLAGDGCTCLICDIRSSNLKAARQHWASWHCRTYKYRCNRIFCDNEALVACDGMSSS
jgi:hypothetical protein